jgi:hypothetical protein
MYLRIIPLLVLIPLLCCNSRPLAIAEPLPITDSTFVTKYIWAEKYRVEDKLVNRIEAPKGYTRVAADKESFTYWLRNIPLKRGTPPVYLYTGELKDNQQAHYAVIDMDPSDKNLLQCADAVMRFRAEYLYASGKHSQIHFKFTSGFNCAYDKWKQGYRPVLKGNDVSWKLSAEPGDNYYIFQAYLETVFNYCGSSSLSKELVKVADVKQIEAGDVFIKGGFPGHAVIVMDVAENKATGDKVFMLAQSYMPAQQPHILKNPTDGNLSPWYSVNFNGNLVTPQWTFEQGALMRWNNQ